MGPKKSVHSESLLKNPSVEGKVEILLSPQSSVTSTVILVECSKIRIIWAVASEGMRMVSRLTRNQLPGNRLRVRLPCPPLVGF